MGVEGGSKYAIKLITPSGVDESNLREILSTLERLTMITEEVFASLRTSIKTQKNNLESISARADTAANMITSLQTSPKALKVVSANKYPLDEEADKFPKNAYISNPVLATSISLKQFEEMFDEKYFVMSSPLRATTMPDELISFFHSSRKLQTDISHLVGLKCDSFQKPPSQLENVDSFYYFNSIENAYVIRSFVIFVLFP